MKLRALVLCAAVLVAACAKPQPPTITPKSIVVTGVSNTGLELRAQLTVANPNSIDLTAKAVKAKVVVGQVVDLGMVNVDKTFTLKANGNTDLDVPLVVNWQSAAPLMQFAQKAMVGYTVDGTVELGDSVSVTVPFHLEGVLKRDQIMQAMMGKLAVPM